MKAAIVGSRTFNDYERLKTFIKEKSEENNIVIDTIVSGGAKGADTLGEQYAEENHLNKLIFKADWNKFGKRAGFIRNVDIIKNCDVCFAFWDGESHGTKHDIELCEQYNKQCFICRFDMDDAKNEKPLSLQDMLEYLKTLRDDQPGFSLYRMFSAIITNEKYCPEEFSQEIEDSEEDKYTERMEFRKKYFDPVWGWENPALEAEYNKLKNSEKWMANHTKKCPMTLDYNIIGICACQQKKITVKSEGGKIEIIFRDYDNETNRQKITDYYNGIIERGLRIYKIV